MAITTYAELQTAIASWLNRSDLTATIPDFISLAEDTVRADLYDAQMETRAYATMSTTSAYLALPIYFRALRRIQIVYAGTQYLVKQRTPAEMPLYDDATTGLPQFVSILADQFQFFPKPDAEYRVEITYYKDVPALTDSNTTNWLLDDYTNVYLYGALRQAALFLFNDDLLARYEAFYREAFNALLRQNQKRSYKGHPIAIRALPGTIVRSNK